MNKLLLFLALVLFFSCNRPIANYTIERSDEIAPALFDFKNESEKAETYSWDFGDGSTSTEESPKHRYLLSGQYNVALTAMRDKKKNTTSKKVVVKAPLKCLVLLETGYGDMLVELFDNTPKHRDNFTKLVSEGFYDSLLFHRVIEGFMIQGGDPNSRKPAADGIIGSGGPGYQIDAEFNNENIHLKGALAAARQPDNVNPEKKSSGSQFYIVQGNSTITDATLDQAEYRTGMVYTGEQREEYKTKGGYPFLDKGYTVFGVVVEGLEVIDKIAEVETKRGDRPVKNIPMKLTLIK